MNRRIAFASLAGCALTMSLSPIAAGAQSRTNAPDAPDASPEIVRPSQRIEVIPLNYADARDVADVLNVLYRGEITASAFPQTNALLVNLSPTGSAAAAPQAPASGRFSGPTMPTPGIGFRPLGGIRPYSETLPPIDNIVRLTPVPQPDNPPTLPEQTNR